ncbi:MAG: 2-C-methyl-D-erythritol 4-phosphate cytidylyltransferase [Burkholderiales bacterium]
MEKTDATFMTPLFYALIPAAGSGSRMGAAAPKQYSLLHGRQVIEHSVTTFLTRPWIEQVYVLVSPEDTHFHAGDRRVTRLPVGGLTRRDTVLNGLTALSEKLRPDDWVLVHDAARPSLTPELLQRLFEECCHDTVGGLLALPVADTLKKADDQGRAVGTIPRTGLWAAQTPQMFRYGLLCEALQHLPSATDESSAIEALGFHPRLIMGEAGNFKLTYPQDWQRAEREIKPL